MTTAHLFYIPVLILVGAFAGYFIGRHAAEEDERKRRKKRKRRAAAESARKSGEHAP